MIFQKEIPTAHCSAPQGKINQLCEHKNNNIILQNYKGDVKLTKPENVLTFCDVVKRDRFQMQVSAALRRDVK